MRILTKKQLAAIRHKLVTVISCTLRSSDTTDIGLLTEIIGASAEIAYAAGGMRMMLDVGSAVPEWRHIDKEVKHAED